MAKGNFDPSGRIALDAGNINAVLQAFTAGTPVEATVDDLVRVRVSPSMSLLSVEILEQSLDAALKRDIETALVGAVNTALQRVALKAGQALSDAQPAKP